MINSCDPERKRIRSSDHGIMSNADEDRERNQSERVIEQVNEEGDRQRSTGKKDKVKDRERGKNREGNKDVDNDKENCKESAKDSDEDKDRGKVREKVSAKESERIREREVNLEKVREKGRDKDKRKGRETEREKGSGRDREKVCRNDEEKYRDTDREKVKDINVKNDREKDRLIDRETDSRKDREKDNGIENEKDKGKDRKRSRETDRDKDSRKDRETQRERGNAADRETDREKDHGKDRETDRVADREIDKGKDRIKGSGKDKEKDRGKYRETDRVADRETDTGKDRIKGSGKDKEKDREKDREKVMGEDKGKDRGNGRETDREKDNFKDREKGSEFNIIKDIEKDKGKDREKVGEREHVREKARDIDRVKERERERGSNTEIERAKDRRREDEKDRGKDREKDKGRDRERSRERSRERRIDRERERERERDRDRQRERERRDRDRDREERRARRREEEDRKDKEEEESGQKTVTLANIIASNPGISVIEAVQRLQAANLNMSMMLGAGAAGSGGGGPGVGGMMMPPTMMSGMPLNASLTGVIGVGGAATKFARELYVGNLPPGVTVPQLTEFLNAAMKQLGLGTGQGSVVSAWVSTDGHYAFVEFRTIEECNASLTYLNGLQIGAHQLRVGRPKTFGGSPVIPPALMGIGAMPNLLASTPGGAGGGGPLGMSALQLGALQGMGAGMLGFGATGATSGAAAAAAGMSNMLAMSMVMSMSAAGGTAQSMLDSNVLMLTNLPLIVGGEQVKELLAPFGQIKAFNLIKDPSGLSRGSAVFEYTDPSTADIALKGLEGLQLGDMRLSIQRVPAQMAALLLQPSTSATSAAGDSVVGTPSTTTISTDNGAVRKIGASSYLDSQEDALANCPPSCVVRLGNMITMADIQDDDLFEELQEDVADECNTHGTVRAVHIPRPVPGATEEENLSRGVGFVFVQFTAVDGATKARAAIAGRSFNGKAVTASYYPEELFQLKGGSSKESVDDSLD